ncbi:hypothetical protein QR680_003122 [Steinernema hermaphroditum]|uniref:Tyrosine specific protein phosphatases domain-containing protein n=1 Tax=Steinernema hermaphroditum TaxID=289476 RepID=A0AA39LJ37_9BILA|nr:hypothetical protein QR680_003122 [Steinernema hermaphroditum]
MSGVKPQYSFLRSKIVQSTPDSIQCKLYCKGRTCKYCNSEPWNEEQQAIKGLYSSWVTKDILAMSRPTTDLINKYDIVGQLKRNNIRSVINLQHVGEHASCGPPLHKSGFSYDPESLMSNGIYFYNFLWPDFGANMNSVLDNVKVVWFALQQGRIAVHCHAGLGRTGALIAAYLVWSEMQTAEAAVSRVRRARPNSIQSTGQIEMLMKFEEVIMHFGRAIPSYPMSFEQYLDLQRQYLPSGQQRIYAHIPKIIRVVCDYLLHFAFDTAQKFVRKRESSHDLIACTVGRLKIDWHAIPEIKRSASMGQIAKTVSTLSSNTVDLPMHAKCLGFVNIEHQFKMCTVDKVLETLHNFMLALKRCDSSGDALVDIIRNLTHNQNMEQLNDASHDQSEHLPNSMDNTPTIFIEDVVRLLAYVLVPTVSELSGYFGAYAAIAKEKSFMKFITFENEMTVNERSLLMKDDSTLPIGKRDQKYMWWLSIDLDRRHTSNELEDTTHVADFLRGKLELCTRQETHNAIRQLPSIKGTHLHKWSGFEGQHNVDVNVRSADIEYDGSKDLLLLLPLQKMTMGVL